METCNEYRQQHRWKQDDDNIRYLHDPPTCIFPLCEDRHDDGYQANCGRNETVAIFAESSAIFTTYVPQAPESISIVAASDVGGGKVVAVSSTYAFTGTLMRIVQGNNDLFRAVVDW